MLLTPDKSESLRKIIHRLYTEDLSNDLVGELSPLVNGILDSHYFATVLFPSRHWDRSLYWSNNPDEFNDAYTELIDRDVLMNALVEQGGPVHLQSVEDQRNPEHQEFFAPLQAVRPVSDCLYIPFRHDGRLRGFSAVARGGLKNSTFNRNDFEIFDFISSFLNESYIRALKMPSPEGNTAYLDDEGRIIDAGDGMKHFLVSLFGREHWRYPGGGEGRHALLFNKGFNAFCSPILQPGKERVSFVNDGRVWNLEFRDFSSDEPFAPVRDLPRCTAVLKENTLDGSDVLDLGGAAESFGFTRRELQVIDCIYRGFSNQEISLELHISGATVKTHIWNIYNKAGVDSRTSLIFLLS